MEEEMRTGCGSWGRNAVLPSFIHMKEGDREWLVSGFLR